MSRSQSTVDLVEVACASQRAAQRAEVEVMQAAVAYAARHSIVLSDPDVAPGVDGDDRLLEYPGPAGVSEFAIAEFAAALGWSTMAGRVYFADVLEIRYRLPRTWARVQAGEVPVWRARLITRHTGDLTDQAAAYVDAQIAPLAHEVGAIRCDRICDQARDLYDPETAEARRAETAETRHVSFHGPDHRLDQGHQALTYLEATLDAADAADLNHVLAEIAHDLHLAGDTDSLDVRRAKALGHLARGDTPDPATPSPTAHKAHTAHTDRSRRGTTRRGIDLVVHLTDSALTGIADCPTLKTHLSLGQVLGWIHDLDPTAPLTIRPVIDLNHETHTTGYIPPPRMREQILLAEPICAFPYCTRTATTHTDLDHVIAYQPDAPTPGIPQTTTDNLAPLCRTHHRLKTHGHWRYDKLAPGHYLWTSATDRTYHKTPTGTTHLHDPPDPRRPE
ncbi:MAG: DUF222 domain-containing protein [Nocardioides sp.]|uniref:HNH endonuclease signature motif containing protein n=1 Tax=Nocardioides sp. TaxID=35761 RepID=UPI0039E39315